jgi:hypothetical protein
LEGNGLLRGYGISNRFGDSIKGNPERISIYAGTNIFASIPRKEKQTMVTKERVVEAAKLLNTAMYEEDGEEIPLLGKKIKTVAVKEDDLKKVFMEAIESLPEGTDDEPSPQEAALPDLVAEVYNELVDEFEGKDGGEPEPEPEPEPEVKEKQKVKTSKEEKSSPKKGPRAGKDKYGNVIGSMAAAMNALLEKGSTDEKIVEMLKKDFKKDNSSAEARWKSHKMFLISKEMLPEEKGQYIIKLP